MFISIFSDVLMNKKAIYSIVIVIIVIVAGLGIYFEVYHPAKSSKQSIIFAAAVSSGEEYTFDQNMVNTFNSEHSNVSVTFESLEKSIADAKEAGCKKFDVYLTLGISGQGEKELEDDIEYATKLMNHEKGSDMKVYSFISPLTPFYILIKV